MTKITNPQPKVQKSAARTTSAPNIDKTGVGASARTRSANSAAHCSKANLPDDLPEIIYWQLDFAVLTSLPRTPVQYVGSGGATNAAIVRPHIPYGTRAWRESEDGPWRPLKHLPPHWLPFLNRKRGTEMDPRPKDKHPDA